MFLSTNIFRRFTSVCSERVMNDNKPSCLFLSSPSFVSSTRISVNQIEKGMRGMTSAGQCTNIPIQLYSIGQEILLDYAYCRIKVAQELSFPLFQHYPIICLNPMQLYGFFFILYIFCKSSNGQPCSIVTLSIQKFGMDIRCQGHGCRSPLGPNFSNSRFLSFPRTHELEWQFDTRSRRVTFVFTSDNFIYIKSLHEPINGNADVSEVVLM